MESGVQKPKIPKGWTRKQSIKTSLFLFGIIFAFVFVAEYVAEYKKLEELHSVESQLQLLPPLCWKYIDPESVKRSETSGLLDLLKVWWDESVALECKRFIMDRERERVRLKWPNPLQVAVRLFCDPFVQMVETLGGMAGVFFHSLMKAQESLLEKMLLLAFGTLLFLLFLKWMEKRRGKRRFLLRDFEALQRWQRGVAAPEV